MMSFLKSSSSIPLPGSVDSVPEDGGCEFYSGHSVNALAPHG